MTDEDVPLVPAELRGYREFALREDGLGPVVHRASGAWADGVHHARCSTGAEHAAPARDCTCGLYGWYDPSSAVGSYGGLRAVVAFSGRVVMADRGFRAARGRIEAVALPRSLRWRPHAAAAARTTLAEHHPSVAVYRSVREMVRDHPPDDLGALGVEPPDRSPLWCRRAAFALWALFVVAGHGLLLLPRDRVSAVAAVWWPLLVLAVVAWQAAMVVLLARSSPRERRPPPGG